MFSCRWQALAQCQCKCAIIVPGKQVVQLHCAAGLHLQLWARAQLAVDSSTCLAVEGDVGGKAPVELVGHPEPALDGCKADQGCRCGKAWDDTGRQVQLQPTAAESVGEP